MIVNTIKVKNKNDFFDLSECMENCEMSGKNQGILKWMLSGNPVKAVMSHKCFLREFCAVLELNKLQGR